MSAAPTGGAASSAPPLELAGRAAAVRAAVAEAGCDALVVTHLVNIRWLTGFTGSSGVLVVTGGALVLVTDGRYGDQARDQAAEAGVELRVEVTTHEVVERVGDAVAGARRVGLEDKRISWADQRRFAEGLEVELVPTSGLVEACRQVKDPGELARLERAAACCDQALAQVMPMLVEGPTEAEFAFALEAAMRRLGADQPSFDTIVAAGPNSARPHHRPGRRRIEPGDLVVIDAGARIDGYGSDMTRTVVVGRQPDDRQARMWEAVRAAQEAGVAAVRAGAEVAAVDAACRDLLAQVGLAEHFVHGTGHGIGLEIHEDPFVNARSVGILRPGQVITVEPGVYLPGVGGVRIEDSVVVTDDGCRPITRSPKAVVVA
jgi:Xaa-Pro aminopeptidase